jgi:hypothetical protein
VRAMNDDERWEMWRSWLGDDPKADTIYAQVVEMMAYRQTWDVFTYVYLNAPPEVTDDATFLLWFRVGFARSQALGVRRMADKRSDVVSLARLIDNVWRYPTVLSRERFIAMQGQDDGFDLADGWFNSLASTGDYIDPRIPAQDYDDLQTKTRSVRDWANTSIAHLTAKGGPREAPPLQALHDAVDDVADLFMKYMQLIRGVTIHTGVIMEPWPFVFRFPWIADHDAFLDVMSKADEAERRRGERPKT